ncbi:Mu transposase C-terminal domain-containing protein [Gemmatimonas sp.]|uniref:Mu transposase C-terminal domain-containing protein n=1 Tax=Gemmatimonas sp. TaxID=1962908 RepID=UPI0022C18520|nr:Mu transposase C-terminal domain-containing protein [Gemmatimonas sp.]MCZ8206528.1 Mu transposase C-terminal domain-containing protein [Gemmatimonas sp.]
MPRQTHNHSAPNTSRFTPQFVLTDALALRARAVGPLQAPDPLLFLHEVLRVVDKDGIDIAGVRFMSPALLPFVGTKVKLPVRYDAAAANRRQLTRVFVIIEATRDRSRSVIECLPRPYVRETTDREGFEAESRRYRESLKQQVEEAVEATARRRGGHAAGQRQRDLHNTRRHQGRAGQEQSGYGPPRPEVEAGVRKAAKAKLEKKLEKLDPTARAKAKTKGKAETKAKTESKSKPGAGRAKKSAGTRRQSTGRKAPGADSAFSAWSQLGKAADSKSNRKRPT